MSIYTVICCFVVIGCVSSVFGEGVETSICYEVNDETHCFYTNGSMLSWNEATEYCERRNSKLPIVTDEDIDNVFQQFLVNNSYSVTQDRYVWIDAHVHSVNNPESWHWINGQPSALTSSNFTNNTDDNCCASIGRENGEPRLYRHYWTDNQRYVCQYDLQQFSSTMTSTSTVKCSPRWIVYPYSQARGAQEHPAATTRQQCLDACVANNRCVVVEWNDVNKCWIHTQHVGQMPGAHTTQFEIVRRCNSTSDPSCDDAFQIDSKCYKIHKERVSWFTAVNRCLSNNASLAVFDDDVRRHFPSSLLSDKAWIGLVKSWWTWPGLERSDVMNSEFNVSSSPSPNNTSQRPNSDYNCVVATTGQWRVSRCDEQHHVVCQSDHDTLIVSSPTTPTTTTPTTTTTTTEVATTLTSESISSTSSTAGPGDASSVGLAVGLVIFFLVLIIIVVVVVVVVLKRRRCRPCSSQYDIHPLQEQPRKPAVDEDNHIYSNANTGEESKPDLIYACIVPDPEANSSEVTTSNNDEDDVIYTELASNGVDHVAPSNDLYANVSR